MITPLGNRVLIRPDVADETTESGIILPDSAKEKPLSGTVVDGGKTERQIGERVVFSRFAYDEVKIDKIPYYLVSEPNILGVYG